MAVCFTIISNLAVTTHVSVTNVRADLFLKGIFITEKRIQLAWWLENKLESLETFKLLSMELTKRVLSCIDFALKKYSKFKFTFETENENSISFLDIKITKDNNKFMTSVYCKPTFSRVFTNFGSFILKSYKYNLLFMLLHRAFKLCSNFEHFYQEIDKLKTIFENNGY